MIIKWNDITIKGKSNDIIDTLHHHICYTKYFSNKKYMVSVIQRLRQLYGNNVRKETESLDFLKELHRLKEIEIIREVLL